MNKRYLQGRAAEYLAQRELEAEGWFTVRAAGSKGAVDIVAWRAERVCFLQIKTFQDRPGSYAKDVQQLSDIMLPPNATAELWIRQHRARKWHSKIVVKENANDGNRIDAQAE